MLITEYFNKAKWVVLLLLFIGIQDNAFSQDKDTLFTIYLVRHAEKVLSDDHPKDPPLTDCGE